MELEIYKVLQQRLRGIINPHYPESKTIANKKEQRPYPEVAVALSDEPFYRICVFDLDNTLIDTDRFEKEREASANGQLDIQAFKARLHDYTSDDEEEEDKETYMIKASLDLVTEDCLLKLREIHPSVKFVVFTRATKAYTQTILSHFYPSFRWDLVVTYEMVQRTKPHSDGLSLIMKKFGETNPRKVLMIGDNDVDIKTAYHHNSPCLMLDWFHSDRKTEHWRAKHLLPDGIITSVRHLPDIIRSGVHLLDLEAKLANIPQTSPRFEKVNHFFPFGSRHHSTRPVPIHVAGRYFNADFPLIRSHHALNQSILDHKKATVFPSEWIASLRDFIRTKNTAHDMIITVIPHRPTREPRLERMLEQLRLVISEDEDFSTIQCIPDIFKFKEGVLSQHKDKLNQEQRFKNMEDHLYVHQTEWVKGRDIIVFDDVVTTGASLLHAYRSLHRSGANDVHLFALAHTISA